jgi:serine/threonine-protein kinase
VFGSLAIDNPPTSDAKDLVAQRKAVALVIYLAVAKPLGFHQRDRIVGLLWPELGQDDARAALRKTLHRVRQTLGDEAIVSQGSEALALAPDAISCDAIDFDRAVADGNLRDALDLYGELLPGFYLPGSAAFEHWLEQERTGYAERAVDVAWKLVKQFAADDQLTNAGQLARRVARLAPTDERRLRNVLMLLSQLNDRAGAVEVYTRFAARLWNEYQTKPSLETQQLMDKIQRNERVDPDR